MISNFYSVQIYGCAFVIKPQNWKLLNGGCINILVPWVIVLYHLSKTGCNWKQNSLYPRQYSLQDLLPSLNWTRHWESVILKYQNHYIHFATIIKSSRVDKFWQKAKDRNLFVWILQVLLKVLCHNGATHVSRHTYQLNLFAIISLRL